MSAPSNPRTFFDFVVGEQALGRVVFELFSDLVPKTVENFRALCTGEKGTSPSTRLPLHYKGSPVHRIIDGFMVQGGDPTGRGSGGESIYGGKFEDERLEGRGTEVDREGLLVMANRGPNTNGSQYFITLAPAPHLTGKHVVFGRVIHGLEHVLTLGKLPTDEKNRPISPVIVAHCGELELRRPAPAAAPVQDTRAARSRSPDSRSPSRSRSKSPPPRKQRRYSTSSGSASPVEDEKARRRREKKERKERRREKKEKKRSDRRAAKGPEEEESEDELDARLEREEEERLEAERKQKEQRAEEERQRILEKGGVVFKGRGTMRYLDPESIASRSIPSNYNSRGPAISMRPPRGMYSERPTGGNLASRIGVRSGDPSAVAGAISDRWVKGVDARPIFEKEHRAKGLDGYKTKGEDQRRSNGGGQGDKDKWDRGREWNSRMGTDAQDGRGRSRSPERKALPNQAAESSPRDRSITPPVRPDSPLRGEKDYGSDMELDD